MFFVVQFNKFPQIAENLQNYMSGFLNISEASAFLKVSPRTLYNICRGGKITFYQGNGRTCKIRFKEDDLLAYMQRFRIDGNRNEN